MSICKVNNLKQAVNGNPKMMSAIRFRGKFNGTKTPLILSRGVSGTDNGVTIKSVDGNVLLGSHDGSIKGNESVIYNHYAVVWPKEDVTYPCDYEIDIYPKYGLTKAQITDLSDVDKYMTVLTDIYTRKTFGDIANLANCPTLVNVDLTTTAGSEDVYGELVKLAPLVNLETLKLHGTFGVWGEIADLMNAMVHNGRTSGTITITGVGPLIYLTYNNVEYRFGRTYIEEGVTKYCYGVVISFNENGWTLDNIVNTYG